MDNENTTRTGECQVCGATQKLSKGGLLVRHGHRNVGPGVGGGACWGASALPAPATDALDLYIDWMTKAEALRPGARLRRSISRLEARKATLEGR
jgi:hypothetical protein